MGPRWLVCRRPAPTDDTVMYITDHTHSACHIKFNSLWGPQWKLQHYTVKKPTLYSTVGLPYFIFLCKQLKCQKHLAKDKIYILKYAFSKLKWWWKILLSYCCSFSTRFIVLSPHRNYIQTLHTWLDIGHTGPKTYCQTPRRFIQKDTPSPISHLAGTNSCTKTGPTDND